MTRSTETERVRALWDKMAPKYDRMIGFWERTLFAGGREWVCGQARGEILEVAIGTGRNLRQYPADVRLTGVEYSPAMLALARERAARHGLDVVLKEADAQDLPFETASFDTVVCTLGLCSIPDDRLAVDEMARVLRPGGTLLLLEHVVSPNPLVSGVQHLLEPLAVRYEGDHLVRDQLPHLRASGFKLEAVEHRGFGIAQRIRATKPARG